MAGIFTSCKSPKCFPLHLGQGFLRSQFAAICDLPHLQRLPLYLFLSVFHNKSQNDQETDSIEHANVGLGLALFQTNLPQAVLGLAP